MDTDYNNWVGRREIGRDFIAAGPLDRLNATLDGNRPLHNAGDTVQPLAHWLFFLPGEAQSTLGADGHPKRGGFLPPVHELPRRMWAGSRLSFHRPLRVGTEVVRTSTIESIETKSGASGPLVFVTVRHEIADIGGELLLTDRHNIVYRGVESPAAKQSRLVPMGTWHRTLVPDDVLLFRYSALTFNGHRIHYDRRYVTDVEGYPGLIVHGPLIATLLIDLLVRSLREIEVTEFSFRAVSPLFDGNEFHLNGEPPDDRGNVKLWASNHRGELAMHADATIRTP